MSFRKPDYKRPPPNSHPPRRDYYIEFHTRPLHHARAAIAYQTPSALADSEAVNQALRAEVKDYALSDFKVIMLNEWAAVVVYRAKTHGVVKGKELKSEVAVTSGWARRGGKWLNVFYRKNVLELDGRRLL